MTITDYFNEAITQNASDVHVVSGEKPMIRIHGVLTPVTEDVLDAAYVEKEIQSIVSEEQYATFLKHFELDFGYAHNGIRFRVNLHKQEGGFGLSARLIPKNIPSPEDIAFEPQLHDFIALEHGLVLVVGPTGHGKSTTLACLIDQINSTRKSHIITIEDPIEFVFESKQSLVEQREIGTDTHSFDLALKHVLRQDPDVILIGEMRDPETIATALTAAETGHLVFSTLHTASAPEAIERIVDVFDGAKQKQILIQLASVLRGVVAQHLLPSTDGKRVAAREILINTPAAANIIRQNAIAQLHSVMQTGAEEGMVPMKKAVEKLVKEGVVDRESILDKSLLG